MQPREKNAVGSQVSDHAEIIVFKRVPKIGDLASQELQPLARVSENVIARFVRPVTRNLRTFHSATGGGFRLLDRIAQHLSLTGMQSGKMGITGRLRIVSEPEIDAAM